MRIDTIPEITESLKVEHTIFKGVRYCFCYWSNHYSSSWDGLKEHGGHGVKFDLQNRVSALFSEEELAAFRPEDTVHNFRLQLREALDAELAMLKKKVKAAKDSWRHSTNYLLTCNPKEIIEERIAFLENFTIEFVKINYV